MSDEIDYKNNPLHGLSLKNLLTEIVNYYGFEILSAYLRMNCFNNNPNLASCLKFLKKTEWAREKVEAFYLYEYKSLPRATSEQYLLPPRDRIIPEGQVPAEPRKLSLEDAEKLRDKRAEKAAAYKNQAGARGPEAGRGKSANRTSYPDHRNRGERETSRSVNPASKEDADPWANARIKFKQ
ncbi:MAG: VF530 family DNA-binding protein [Pseudohongiellaceae bacterium]